MSSSISIHILKPACGMTAEAAARCLFPEAEIQSDDDGVNVFMPETGLYPKEGTLANASLWLRTDVICVGFQSTANLFYFAHFKGGVKLRVLAYFAFDWNWNSSCVWQRVEGQPEPWESSAFWQMGGLACELDNAGSSPERFRIERIWDAGTLIAGETTPSISAEGATDWVRDHYNLPG